MTPLQSKPTNSPEADLVAFGRRCSPNPVVLWPAPEGIRIDGFELIPTDRSGGEIPPERVLLALYEATPRPYKWPTHAPTYDADGHGDRGESLRSYARTIPFSTLDEHQLKLAACGLLAMSAIVNADLGAT